MPAAPAAQRARGYPSVQQAIAEGRSVRIDAIQRFSRELLHFTRQVEQELACIANINLYYSPRSSQALPKHFDLHDVFVLQIYGQKQWTLFDSNVETPLEYLPPLRWEPRGRARFSRDTERTRLQAQAEGKPTKARATRRPRQAGRDIGSTTIRGRSL